MRQIGKKSVLMPRRTVILLLLLFLVRAVSPLDSYASCHPGACTPGQPPVPCTSPQCPNGGTANCENGTLGPCECFSCPPNQVYIGNDPTKCQQSAVVCDSSGTSLLIIQYAQTGCDCQPSNRKDGCYDGDPGTKEITPCHAGYQTCNDGFWTACTGQVTPKPEICDGSDNNCNGEVDDGLDPCCNNPNCGIPAPFPNPGPDPGSGGGPSGSPDLCQD